MFIRSIIVALSCALLLTTGCQATQNLPHRLSEDLFVVVTSPAQVPVVASLDTYDEEKKALSLLASPVTFPYQILKHLFFMGVHALDLAAFPLHLIHDSDSLGIYDGCNYPLEDGPNSNDADGYFLALFAGTTAFIIGMGAVLYMAFH